MNTKHERMLWEVGTGLRECFTELGIQETLNLLPNDVISSIYEVLVPRAWYSAERDLQEDYGN